MIALSLLSLMKQDSAIPNDDSVAEAMKSCDASWPAALTAWKMLRTAPLSVAAQNVAREVLEPIEALRIFEGLGPKADAQSVPGEEVELGGRFGELFLRFESRNRRFYMVLRLFCSVLGVSRCFSK